MNEIIATPSGRTRPDPGSAPLRSELRLLMDIASLEPLGGYEIDPDRPDAFDWRWLVDACGRHKLVRPLLDKLPEMPLEPPRWVRPALWVRARRSQAVARRHGEELCRLNDLLARRGIEFRAMRGPVLSVLAFGDPGQREFSDLDILVRPPDVERTRSLLDGEGYRSFHNRFKAEQSQAVQMSNPERNIGLDLHWSAVPKWVPIGSQFDVMHRSPMWVEIDGHDIPTPPKEETILVQVMQCIKSGWVELDRWYDLTVLCDRWRDLDWDRIVHICRDHGYFKSLALTLRLLGPRASRDIPDDLRRCVEHDINIGRAERLVLERLPDPLIKQREVAHPPGTLALTRDYVPMWVFALVRLSAIDYPIAEWWLVTDDWRRRWWFRWWVVTPSPIDYEAVRLPSALSFLYYVVRPVRLLLRAGRSLLTRGRPA